MPKHFSLALAMSLALIPACALGAPWLPLTAGMRWEYRGAGGQHQIETITGFTTLHGRVVAVKSYAEGADAGLQNYWFLAPDGSVMLAGFLNPSASLAWVYEPPVRYLPVPPVVGPGPDVLTSVHDLFTDALLFQTSMRFDVTEQVTLAVPAGSFPTFGVGRLVNLPGPGTAPQLALTMDGRALPPPAPGIFYIQSTDWFSEGVGVVQYQSFELLQLVGFGSPVPVAHSSWARVKRLYH